MVNLQMEVKNIKPLLRKGYHRPLTVSLHQLVLTELPSFLVLQTFLVVLATSPTILDRETKTSEDG